MSWRPHIGTPDPASAWFTDRQLAELRHDERAREAFARMVEHRNRFEAAVRRCAHPTPDDIARLWRESDPGRSDAATDRMNGPMGPG